MPWICWVSSSMPGGAKISALIDGAATSISISLSSSSPSRSFLRNFCRVAESCAGSGSALKPTARAGGSRASSTRSSAASSARSRTDFIARSRPSLIAISIRSRMMVSTSRPT